MAAVTIRYGSEDGDNTGDVIAKVTACHISSTDLPANTGTGYDADNYPASPEVLYYFQAELAGQDDLRSQVFAPNAGHGEWHGLIFPAAGAWDVHAYRVEDDSSVATLSVTVVE